MKEIILESLQRMEDEKDVKILFACESGSRAWGFHSPDSDYDVRFVYVHKRKRYLELENMKEFIEFPKDEILDIVGYDLRKMLKLFRSSNAKIFEWIQSPVLYRQDEAFLNNIKSLAGDYFSPKAGLYHYLGLCRNTFGNYLQGDKIKLKKYFYAIRPLLAARWIVKYNSCPPMEFETLRLMVDDKKVDQRIELLLKQKAVEAESFFMSPDPMLQIYIQEKIAEAEAYAKYLESRDAPVQPLNELFQQSVEQYDYSGT
jgi:uncharacterized protein